MLVGGMVEHQVGDDADAAPVRAAHQVAEIFQRAVLLEHAGEIGDVVAVVAQR